MFVHYILEDRNVVRIGNSKKSVCSKQTILHHFRSEFNQDEISQMKVGRPRVVGGRKKLAPREQSRKNDRIEKCSNVLLCERNLLYNFFNFLNSKSVVFFILYIF